MKSVSVSNKDPLDIALLRIYKKANSGQILQRKD